MTKDHDTGSNAEAGLHTYIPPEAQMREGTVRAVVLGTLLGIVFGASSLYLVLKVGMTVSASIPVAVISLTLFRLWSKFGGRDATILENNIVQTAGSAGESIAFGVGVTMPAIMILGFDLELARVTLVAVLGALLGILMMIPLRRALIVQQHGKLKYPEGTACAELLKAGANAESRAQSSEAAQREHRALASARGESAPSAATIFGGFGLGLLYKTAMAAGRLWKDTPEKIFGAPLKAGSISVDISPELLGVGYVIGPKTSCIMMAGGVLSYLILIPIIKFFGESLAGALAPGRMPIKDMGPDDIRGAYILYIGAGAVAAGGIISLLRSAPMIWGGLRSGLADFGAAVQNTRAAVLRTERDLPMTFVGVGCLLLVLAIWLAPTLQMNVLGAILIVVFGFLFVTVSSRLTGEIGSSSNPISGMTVATLLLTCLIFVLLKWTGSNYYVTALSVGGIVCIAASNGGSTSQDLKTGFLLGATPRYQQIAILIGAAASALVMGPMLLKLNAGCTVYVPIAEVEPGLHAPTNAVFGSSESLVGPQGQSDRQTYRSWQNTNEAGARPGKYLVDAGGAAVYFVDPGVNGTFKTRPDKTTVTKFSAPKAVLMSYIIKGILNSKLPWALVLFGVMISIMLELSGVPSLAFAVGVYLPISASTPLFVGGLVRWIVDRQLRRSLQSQQLTEAQLSAEADKSPGVLLASGYIAGGALAGILIACVQGGMSKLDSQITDWSSAHNPFYAGPNADLLALIPFAAITAILYFVARKSIAKTR
jgi:putative OPT family oligopeptide transporter